MLLLALLGGLPATLALVYVTWAQQYSFEVRWTLTTIVGGCLDRRGSGRLSDGHPRALSSGQPARRAARGGLLHPRNGHQAGQRRRPGDAGDQRARRHAAAAADRGRRIDQAAAERDGRHRRGRVRLRHGRSPRAGEPRRRAADRAAGGHRCSDAAPSSCAWPTTSPAIRRGSSSGRSGRKAAGWNCAARPSGATASRTSCSSSPISAGRSAKKSSRPGSASSGSCRTRSTTR